ncbi:MAG TPA: hypothetical protein VE640_09220, partial [Candidatus Bathyarchaeia archaeon]|nr:hypothetical protein [Candidatus Bathyarchaeia archaeon]
PGKVATIRSMWQAGSSGQLATGFIGSPIGRIVSLLLLVAVLAVLATLGLGRWSSAGPSG